MSTYAYGGGYSQYGQRSYSQPQSYDPTYSKTSFYRLPEKVYKQSPTYVNNRIYEHPSRYVFAPKYVTNDFHYDKKTYEYRPKYYHNVYQLPTQYAYNSKPSYYPTQYHDLSRQYGGGYGGRGGGYGGYQPQYG